MFPLQAGGARIELNAPLVELSGFAARNAPATGTRDPLFTRSLALSDGARTAIIITVDALGFEAEFVRVARETIAAATSVPTAHIMLCATHTHTAPASMYLRRCGEISSGWIAQLLQAIVESARQAVDALQPAHAFFGSVAVRGVSINRRQIGNPIDYDLDILRLDKSGSTLASLLSFGSHPIAAGGSTLISADFPGVLLREIEEKTGTIGLYANGASADINPLMPGTNEQWGDGNFERVEAIGARLADAAMQAWPNLQPLESGELQIVQRTLELPLQEPLAEDELRILCDESLAAQKASAQNGEYSQSAAAIFEWAMKLRQSIARGDVVRFVPIELQMIRLGEVALFGIPGELFAALGLEIKNCSPHQNTFVLGTTNGNIGYIAPCAAYENPLYEIGEAHRYYNYPAALSPEAGEMLVKAACEMTNQKKINENRKISD